MTSASKGTIERPGGPALEALCHDLRVAAPAVGVQGAWPTSQLNWCGDRGVFRWFLPTPWGGLGWNTADTVEGLLQLGAACLTTTFVLTQLSGACRRLADCDNRQLQQRVLPALASGSAHSTLAISHLTTSQRHLSKPALLASEDKGGFRLDGFSAWVTGAAHVDNVLAGAELADGRQFLVHLPLSTDGVSVDEPASLVGLSGSKTGRVRFDNVLVDRHWLLAAPMKNVMQSGVGASTGGLQTSTLALGLAKSAIEYVQAEAVNRPELTVAADQLLAEMNEHLAMLRSLASSVADDLASAIADLRVKSNSFVLRATQSALVAAKGAGYVSGHPAGRWCQEALFFLVWSCPQPVAAASLCELARIE